LESVLHENLCFNKYLITNKSQRCAILIVSYRIVINLFNINASFYIFIGSSRIDIKCNMQQ